MLGDERASLGRDRLGNILMFSTLADFDYALPAELIAQAPLSRRSASRLLVLEGSRHRDADFSELPQWLRAGDLLVMNDSRVMHARLLGHKDSGGRVEVLVERVLDHDIVLAQLRASKEPQPGKCLRLEGALDVEVLGRQGEFYRLRFPGAAGDLLEAHGRLPLPPYIEREPGGPDELRYQTVYAREKGSVAAPTAGLHFDGELLTSLREKGVDVAFVTLHVGAGTFQPVRSNDLTVHRMHSECYLLPRATVDALAAAKGRGGRIVAVGTTSLRVLESAAREREPMIGASATAKDVTNSEVNPLTKDWRETALFITPGFEFLVADLLITNFHLPKSTLLMLVSAFAGVHEIRSAYQHAVAAGYRFFSYGDAMLLHRASRK